MTTRLTYNLLLDVPFAVAGQRMEIELKKMVDNGLCCLYSPTYAGSDSPQAANNNRTEEMTMNIGIRMATIRALDATWPDNQARTDAQLWQLAAQAIAEGC